MYLHQQISVQVELQNTFPVIEKWYG